MDETEKHKPRANPETQAEHDEKDNNHDGNGGFALRGPVGFGAEFPESASGESKWVIRAIAVAILVLAICYGWSLIQHDL